MTDSGADRPGGGTGGRAALIYRAAVVAVLAYCALQVGMHMRFAILPDGSNWQQGDWLINSRLVPIRRGLFGSALIGLSDLTGIGLLTLTIAVQLALLAALLGALAAVFLPARDRLAHLLLLASPGFVPLFWGSDPNGALRKEMVAFLALALLVLALRRRDRLLHGVSAGLLMVSFFGSEICVLFAPLFVGATILTGWRQSRSHFHLAMCVAVLAGALAAGAYAVIFASIADVAPICAPLLRRGLTPYMCEGAIAYLTESGGANAAQVRDYVLTTDLVHLLPISALIGMAGPAYVISLADRRGPLVLACLLAALPFTALYLVAVDWGRWLNMQVFSVVLVLVIAVQSGLIKLCRPVRPVAVALLFMIGLYVSPDHTMRIVRGGVIAGLAMDWNPRGEDSRPPVSLSNPRPTLR